MLNIGRCLQPIVLFRKSKMPSKTRILPRHHINHMKFVLRLTSERRCSMHTARRKHTTFSASAITATPHSEPRKKPLEAQIFSSLESWMTLSTNYNGMRKNSATEREVVLEQNYRQNTGHIQNLQLSHIFLHFLDVLGIFTQARLYTNLRSTKNLLSSLKNLHLAFLAPYTGPLDRIKMQTC